MLTGLDHLVILARDLDEAVAAYRESGFRVMPGGEHADGLTHNALVPFADGTYLELVAFLDPGDPRDNVWGWRPFLDAGGGLVDYCVASDDLEKEVRRLRSAGFEVEGPDEGGRRRPDGEEIRWKVARLGQEAGRTPPFLIQDLTDRGARVPGGPATEHPNGVTGISRLLVAARDALKARRSLAALAGEVEEAEGGLHLGPHELAVITSESPDDPVGRRLASLGDGPFAAEIIAPGGGPVDDFGTGYSSLSYLKSVSR